MFEFYETGIIWSVDTDIWQDIVKIYKNEDDGTETVYSYGEPLFRVVKMYLDEKFNASREVREDNQGFYPDFETENKLTFNDYGFLR